MHRHAVEIFFQNMFSHGQKKKNVKKKKKSLKLMHIFHLKHKKAYAYYSNPLSKSFASQT